MLWGKKQGRGENNHWGRESGRRALWFCTGQHRQASPVGWCLTDTGSEEKPPGCHREERPGQKGEKMQSLQGETLPGAS